MKMNFSLWLAVAYAALMVRGYIVDAPFQYMLFLVLTALMAGLGLEEALEDRERRIKAAMRRHPAGGRGNL